MLVTSLLTKRIALNSKIASNANASARYIAAESAGMRVVVGKEMLAWICGAVLLLL